MSVPDDDSSEISKEVIEPSKNNIVCEKCDISFNHERYLDRHNKSYHSSQESETNEDGVNQNDDLTLQKTSNLNTALDELQIESKYDISPKNGSNDGENEIDNYLCVSGETGEDFPVYVLIAESSKAEETHESSNIENICESSKTQDSEKSLKIENSAIITSKDTNDKSSKTVDSNESAITESENAQEETLSENEKEDEDMISKEEDGKVVCRLCKTTFSNVSYLRRHVNKFHSSSTAQSMLVKEKSSSVKNVDSMKKSDSAKPRSQVSSYDEDIWSTCGLCSKKFNNPLQLTMHERKGCPMKDKSNTSEKQENNGNSNDESQDVGSKRKNSEKEDQSATYSKRTRFDNHLTMASLRSEYICNICGKVFQADMYLLRHYNRCHPNEQNNQAQHTCRYCNKKFCSYNTYKRHINDTHGEEIHAESSQNVTDEGLEHTCKICYRAFPTIGYLLRHHNRYHSDQTADFPTDYTCSLCDQKFCSKKSYQKHVRTHDLVIELDESGVQYEVSTANSTVEEVDTAGTIRCTQCNSTFSSTQYLFRHCNRYHKDNPMIDSPYKCLYCKKIFGSINSFRKHKLQHSHLSFDKKNSEESSADKNSKQQRNSRESSKEKNSSMNLSNDSLSADIEEGEISNPNLSSSKQQLLVCENCDATFTKQQYLNRHINRYHRKSAANDESTIDFNATNNLNIHSPTQNDNSINTTVPPSDVEGVSANTSKSEETHVTDNVNNQPINQQPETVTSNNQSSTQPPTCSSNNQPVNTQATTVNSNTSSSKSDQVLLSVYQCNHCSEYFDNPYLLNCHQKRRHGSLPQEKFPKRQVKFVSPSQTQSDKNIVFCSICKKTFNHQQYLTRHNNKYHRNKSGTPVQDSNEFQCSDGSFVITQQQKNELNKMCEDLKQVSQTITKMNKQITTLASVKATPIINLDDMLKEISQMRDSIDNIENKINIYNNNAGGSGNNCENDPSIDDMRFTISFEHNNINIADENITQHGNSFPCNYCNKVFNKIQYLSRHQNQFHSDKVSTPYKCEFCNVYFNQKPIMLNHMKKFHSSQLLSARNTIEIPSSTVTSHTQDIALSQGELKDEDTEKHSALSVEGEERRISLPKADTTNLVKEMITSVDDNTSEMPMDEIEQAVMTFVKIPSRFESSSQHETSLPDPSTNDDIESDDIKASIVILGHDETFQLDSF